MLFKLKRFYLPLPLMAALNDSSAAIVTKMMPIHAPSTNATRSTRIPRRQITRFNNLIWVLPRITISKR